MLDIPRRIEVIKSLLLKNTAESLTYAALESRLTIEYLCYERFKLSYTYLSAEDLKHWQPKHVVKQISEEINENVVKGFTLSISAEPLKGKLPTTREEYESIEYIPVGSQSAINLNKLHEFWHGFSNLALHIPVPNISSGDISIYGDKDNIKKKIEAFIEYLSKLKDGNLLMGGVLGKGFSFNCFVCETLIKKPLKLLASPIVVSCINPKCNESYLIEPELQSEHKITRCTFNFSCVGCQDDLEIPSNVFKGLKFEQQLNICCGKCKSNQTVVMRPMIKGA
ncbi:hypothetical protein [Cellvibrio mixtus]|uniref:hypothetical protein n=1 Tax=Cellvibrio mixtus TaxID=39650 RepID=UPI000586D3E4|nr:hypothetical protein [Cellvibrio mixtus]